MEKTDTNDDHHEDDVQTPESKPAIEYGEQEIAILVAYIQQVSHSLLDLNKDLLNWHLHQETTLAMIKNFAENK